ncbi:uncharacterized protein [Heterodontus francisci]|uniref:uncharacterized protein n=1 Tax=Heterodontus francisci TaxID=7792 RepID=UPI00355C73A5
MRAKRHKQHAKYRAKGSHNQRIRSKFCSLATSSHEWCWRIKQLTGGGGSTNIPILNDGAAQHISVKDKAEAFATIFSQKCRVDAPSWTPPEVPSITDARLQPIRFTPRDIKKRLKALDTAKALGPDNIPAIVPKTCAPEHASSLSKLFQCSDNTGISPAMWKIDQVCPLHKTQEKSNPANYHPSAYSQSSVKRWKVSSTVPSSSICFAITCSVTLSLGSTRATQLLTSLQPWFKHGQKS